MIDLFALDQHEIPHAALPINTSMDANPVPGSVLLGDTGIVYAGGDNFPNPPPRPK